MAAISRGGGGNIRIENKHYDNDIVISKSATKKDPDPRGKVLITGSHCGVYVGYLAIKAKVRAGVFNDASVGKDSAAIEGLKFLDENGVAAAAVDSNSAMIGNGLDVYENGILSFVNQSASRLGCTIGMKCRDAVELLKKAPLVDTKTPVFRETRTVVYEEYPKVACIDSVSLVLPDDKDSIIVTGSHGGILGDDKRTAIKYDVIAAFYNDAGIGKNNAGISRLPALDERGIIAGTVDAMTAKIGDGISTYEDGILSCINNHAKELGAIIGMPLREFIGLLRRKLQLQR